MRCGRIEGSGGLAHSVDIMLRRLQSLPAEVARSIAEALEHSNGRFFAIGNQKIRANFRLPVTEMLDPEGQICRMARVVLWVGAMLQASAPDPQIAQMTAMSGAQNGMAQIQRTCAYCSSTYLLNQPSQCPNCGAPTAG